MSAGVSGAEPSLSGYADLCRRSWKLVVGLVFTAAVVAGGLSLAQADVYSATADVRFGSASRLERAADLARSTRIERAASRDLGFHSAVTVAYADSSTLRFTAEGESPRRVAEAADVYARTVARSIAHGGKVVSRAKVPDAPSRPTTARNVAFGAALGLVLSLGVILVRSKV